MKGQEINREEIEVMLKNSTEMDAPSWLSAQIMEEVSARAARAASRRRSPRWANRRSVGRFSLGLCVVVLSAMVSFWTGRQYQQGEFAAQSSGDDGRLIPTEIKDASSSFFIGKGLLAGGLESLALSYLRQAAKLDPTVAEYSYWTGIAYWRLGETDKERNSYLRALQQQPDYLPSLMNLGHVYLEEGQYAKAIELYDRVLTISPHESKVLYNKGLALLLQGNGSAAETELIRFLDQQRQGKWAQRAVRHLYSQGNYRFRSFRVGVKDIVLDADALLFDKNGRKQREIERLASVVSQAAGYEVHLVVYSKDDLHQAKQLAKDLKNNLLNILGADTIDIKTSWFDEPQVLMARGERNSTILPDSVLIFTRTKEERDRRSSS